MLVYVFQDANIVHRLYIKDYCLLSALNRNQLESANYNGTFQKL